MNKVYRFVLIFACFCLSNSINCQTFSQTIHFEHNSTNSGRVLLAAENSCTVLSSEFCNFPPDQECLRYLDIRIDDSGFDVLHQRLETFDNNELFDTGHSEYFIRSGNSDQFYLAMELNSNWSIRKLDADFSTLWEKSFPSSSSENPTSVYETSTGNILLYGSSSQTSSTNDGFQLALRKLDSSGDLIWFKKFPFHNSDELYSIVEDIDGNYICTGVVNRFGEDGNGLDIGDDIYLSELTNGFVMKLDTAGNVLWEKEIQGLPEAVYEHPIDGWIPNPIRRIDGPIFATGHPDGGYVYYQSLGKYENMFWPLWDVARVVRVDDEFNVLWEYRFEGEYLVERPFPVYINSIELTSDGDIIGCGTDWGRPNEAGDNGWLFKISKDGELLWSRTFEADHSFPDITLQGNVIPSTPPSTFYDLLELADGSILVVGDALTAPQSYFDLWILRTDENGCLSEECDSEILYVSSANGHNNQKLEEEPLFYVYPNPFKNEFNVRLSESYNHSNARISLVDLNGSVLRTQVLYSEQTIFQVTLEFDLSPGLYILQYETDEGVLQTRKLLNIIE